MINQPPKQMEYQTPKGTILPLLNLKGKPYLQVAHRIVWFREEKPEWVIHTIIEFHDQTQTTMRAEIFDETGKLRSMARKQEHQKDFKDHLEKAETSSIGRALALIGYGTQFAPDLDEGERLADSPMPGAKTKEQVEKKQAFDLKRQSLVVRLTTLYKANRWDSDTFAEILQSATGANSINNLTNDELDLFIIKLEKQTSENRQNQDD